jgi:alpha-N-acetylglucosaminidase
MKIKFLTLIVAVLFTLSAYSNPVDELINRIDPGAAKKFRTELVPAQRDFFELSQDGNRVSIKGNTWVNIATGLNWYLKYYAGIHLSWNNMRVSLPVLLPRVRVRSAMKRICPCVMISTIVLFLTLWLSGTGNGGRQR